LKDEKWNDQFSMINYQWGDVGAGNGMDGAIVPRDCELAGWGVIADFKFQISDLRFEIRDLSSLRHLARCRMMVGMTERTIITLTQWPDPLQQERVEEIGFFFDRQRRGWVLFVNAEDVDGVVEWAKKHQLAVQSEVVEDRGAAVRYPRLSAELVRRDGGGPGACALCGAANVPCWQWIEGDDTDSIEYPNAPRFYMCGRCVQEKMAPHPRLYARARDVL
jgi:hypothetical protein